jgi:2-polyprenyl-6-methoxyphenol hydroxylase-like FAD-dependent oxidoreductase
MMLGFLLARMGVDVVVLEQHADFLRDFRGDTIHPSTLEIMYELGILTEFLKRPHEEVRELAARVGDETVMVADFTHLPTHCKFLALMPQWHFLDFIAEQGRSYPSFHLRMQAKVTDLIEENGVVAGVRAETPGGPLEVRATLTVGADGRRSLVRERAGLQVIDLGAPMDVMWMRISRLPDDPVQTFGNIEPGKILVMINREDYWQCAYVIPKGSAEAVRQRGLPAFRDGIAELSPYLAERVSELRDWKDVSVLTVAVDRLAQWSRPGLLCIGDAAHAMSPVGGVGINLAIQDAVATANILGQKLLRGNCPASALQDVQRRRMFPTRAMQRLQVAIHKRVVGKVLSSTSSIGLPWPLRLLNRFPILRRIPARIVGLGFRPEHIQTPKITPQALL